MTMEDRFFIIPARLPHPSEVKEFFSKLGTAVISDFRKVIN